MRVALAGMRSFARSSVRCLLILAALAVVPTVALGAAADEPLAIDDPPAVLEGSASDVAVTPDAPAATPVEPTSGPLDRAEVEPTVGAAAEPVVSARPYVGPLPFTGTDPGRIAALLAVGSLLVVCGVALRRRSSSAR